MLNRARRVGFLLGICAVAAALAPAASQAPDPKKSLAQEQLGLARQALEVLDQMHKNGQVSPDDPRIAVWERRQVEAVRDAGTGRAEFIAALEGYVKRMRDRQRIVEQRQQSGQAYFVDVLDAKYRVLEAEMWLNQEKAR
jgi:outer membrane protein TolC